MTAQMKRRICAASCLEHKKNTLPKKCIFWNGTYYSRCGMPGPTGQPMQYQKMNKRYHMTRKDIA